MTDKIKNRNRAKYLRDLDGKLFSYGNIATIFNVSKSYISGLLKTKEGEING
jgi:hypothetical protein